MAKEGMNQALSVMKEARRNRFVSKSYVSPFGAAHEFTGIHASLPEVMAQAETTSGPFSGRYRIFGSHPLTNFVA